MSARLLRLRLPLPKLAPAVVAGIWPPLAAPIFPAETALRMRAQSLLSGAPVGQCPPLSLEQARTVLAWINPARSNTQ